jgi:hypothetical protein
MTDQTTTAPAPAATMAAGAPAPDLVDRMRRMSLDSDLSSYSIISEAPSVIYLNTNGSANGGVTVASVNEEAPEDEFHDLPPLEALPEVSVSEDDYEDLPPLVALPEVSEDTRDPMSVTPTFTVPAGSYAVPSSPPTAPLPGFAEFLEQVRGPSPSAVVLNLRGTVNRNDAHIQSSRPSSTPPPVQEVAGFWLQFPEFVLQPKASFKTEFARLAKAHSWNVKAKRKHQVEALTSEIDFHYGKCLDKLDRWQQLCKDVGIENIPTSITKCRKVSATSVVKLRRTALTNNN